MPIKTHVGHAAGSRGCCSQPSDFGVSRGPRILFWEERWEILGLTEHGNIVDARLIVTNRELIRGQGRVHLNYWSPAMMPVIHTREVDPARSYWIHKMRV